MHLWECFQDQHFGPQNTVTDKSPITSCSGNITNHNISTQRGTRFEEAIKAEADNALAKVHRRKNLKENMILLHWGYILGSTAMYNPQHYDQNKSGTHKIGAGLVLFWYLFLVLFLFSPNSKPEAANMLAPSCPQGFMILFFCSAVIAHSFQYQGHVVVQEACCGSAH